jgi:Protein kinase domain
MREDEIKSIPPSGKPVISSRLPKAFSQPKHLTTKKSNEHQDSSAVDEFKKVKKLLSPLKRTSPKASAFRKVLNKLASFPVVTEKSLSMINIDFLSQSVIKLEEMITLSIIKSSCGASTVRKSLHAPTFKIYATKEISLNTLSTRKKILGMLKSWQKVQKHARYLVEVFSSFWNSPEGCVTLVMEYMPGNSLEKLCDSIGAIPEKILKSISKRILTALSFFHKKVGAYGCIRMNNIMFDSQGKSKLGIGFYSKEDEINNFEQDIFSFGTCMIGASLGSPDWIPEIAHKTCCLLHSISETEGVPYLSRFSVDYKDFLCRATNYKSRATINELISHPWITSSDAAGIDVTMQELLEISFIGNKELGINVDRQLVALIESLRVVLTGRDDTKPTSPSVVKELALELGLDTLFVYNKVLEIFKTR